MTYVTTEGSSQVTTSVATATNRTILIKGIMRINGGGTIIPQFKYSAAPGAAPTLGTNNFFLLYPVGSNSVTSVGNWN
jgi:hypothetical protein